MEPIIFRALLACLLVWLIEKTLSAFKVGDPASTIVMIVAVIVAWLFVLIGWALPLVIK